MRQSDGSVIPSIFDLAKTDIVKQNLNNGQFALKMGNIEEIIYPDDKRNIRKNKIEYTVQVKERQGGRGFVVTRYRNVITSDMFGGLADSIEFTHRPSTSQDQKDPVFRNGSSVLLLCLHGDTSMGFIVGGMRHNAQKKIATKDKGHFFEFEFNGINFNINKDGEMAITYKGKTDIDGSQLSALTSPTVININKDGDFSISDNEKQKISMSRKNKKIRISSGNDKEDFIEIDKAKKDITVEMANNAIENIGNDKKTTVRKNRTAQIDNNSETKIGGSRTDKIGSTWKVTTGGTTVLTFPKILIGSEGATQPLVLGTNYLAHITATVATLNALVALVSANVTTSSSHTHTYLDDNGTSTILKVTGAPPPGSMGAPAPAPAPIPTPLLISKKSFCE